MKNSIFKFTYRIKKTNRGNRLPTAFFSRSPINLNVNSIISIHYYISQSSNFDILRFYIIFG